VKSKPISINQRLRCERVYPMEGSKKQLSKLETLVLDLTPEQAEEFGSALRGLRARGLGTIQVVAFRVPLKDGRHRLAVRAYKEPPAKPRGGVVDIDDFNDLG
jgi:hypothetical protein